MKNMILSAVLCGGILIVSSPMLTAHADTLTGTTAVSSKVVKGDVTLDVDSTINFGEKPLNSVVDFGTKPVNYTVTDYSGNSNGFTISAKLADVDAKRSLKIGSVELSDKEAMVVTKATDVVGDNTDNLSATLMYTGVDKVQSYTSSIEWTLTKGTSSQIIP